MGGVGIRRALSLKKYLPQNRINTYVLTVSKVKGYYATEENYDRNIVRFLAFDPLLFLRHKKYKPSGTKKRFIRHLFWPDFQAGIILPGIKKGFELIKKKDISLIISTAPPWSSHILAYYLSRKTNVPLVLDFRDPWVGCPIHDTDIKKPLNRYWERKLINHAKIVFTATATHRTTLVQRHKKTHIFTVRNGFDSLPEYNPEEKGFTIAYSGILGVKNTGLNLYKAIRNLSNKFNIKLKIFGDITEKELKLIKDTGIINLCEIIPFLPHKQFLNHLAKANIAWFSYNFSYSKDIIPAKLYEYIGMKIPILATIDKQHESAKIIEKAGTGIVVEPNNHKAIEDALLRLIKKEFLFKPNIPFISTLTRKNEAKKMASIIFASLKKV